MLLWCDWMAGVGLLASSCWGDDEEARQAACDEAMQTSSQDMPRLMAECVGSDMSGLQSVCDQLAQDYDAAQQALKDNACGGRIVLRVR
jgi:hypothetical protein